MIAIGPVSRVPSWQWVGIDTIKELSKYITVEVFNNYDALPHSNVILIIKQIPPEAFATQCKKANKKIIYCPIDYFENEQYISSNRGFLNKCEIILSHAESLIPILKPFAPTYLIEHNGKFTLPQISDYKKDGYILWIGGFQFVPYLTNYLKQHGLSYKIKLLTDYKNESAIGRAKVISRMLEIPFNMNEFEMYEWNEELQIQMMQECKVAIDIKGENFSQRHKPPTKGQKYISSGIPFAINPNNNCFDYFQKDFHICTPVEQKRWFSKDYYDETISFGKTLRDKISIYSVGKEYYNHIMKLIDKNANSDFIGITLNSVEIPEHNQ